MECVGRYHKTPGKLPKVNKLITITNNNKNNRPLDEAHPFCFVWVLYIRFIVIYCDLL
jgi:hypothetical protein